MFYIDEKPKNKNSRVKIHSREEMKDIFWNELGGEVPPDTKIISVNDREYDLLFKRVKSEKILSLHFHDIQPGRWPSDYILFNEHHADAVKNFFDSETKNWYVHCAAGISRSGAIGTWLAEKLGLSVEELHKAHPRVYPNKHVLRILRNE